ncbi:DUF4179 domain-containing protein [Clostridium thermobutyricum]|uniref:DUF4179 domain-containing protein n=1 Tax=Clostridium thermobutyricum DSM 4928 TaxID=1121339 RepID=A0A1V4SZB7_9CLOT|nr:DUF4179 domain-containing protein [Clostridium thermobutyricum]OPX49762.1 hypothetical protein CLTHE_04930 [Clostridium thermobutyricum DSM 4928]
MDFDKFDKKLKSEAKNIYKEIPDNINEKIDQTLNKLGKEKKKNKVLKRGLIAAAVVLIVCGTGITTIAVEKGVSVKDIIYEILGFSKEYSDYAVELNETKERDGIKITIKNVVTDGYRMSISYEVESDKYDIQEVKEKLYTEVNKINGEEVTGVTGGIHYKVEDDKLIGVYDILLSEAFLGEMKFDENNVIENKILGRLDNGEIEFIFNMIKSDRENDRIKWKFKIPITTENMMKNINVYPVDIGISGGSIKEIVITPLKVYVRGLVNETLTQDEIEKISMDYIIKDDSGIGLRSVTSSIDINRKNFYIEYDNKFKDLSNITILENKYLENDEDIDEKTYLEINENGFKQSGGKEVKILDVKNKDGKTYIKYKCKYPNIMDFGIDYETHKHFESITEIINENTSMLILTNGELAKGKYTFSYIKEDTFKLINEIPIKLKN